MRGLCLLVVFLIHRQYGCSDSTSPVQQGAVHTVRVRSRAAISDHEEGGGRGSGPTMAAADSGAKPLQTAMKMAKVAIQLDGGNKHKVVRHTARPRQITGGPEAAGDSSLAELSLLRVVLGLNVNTPAGRPAAASNVTFTWR